MNGDLVQYQIVRNGKSIKLSNEERSTFKVLFFRIQICFFVYLLFACLTFFYSCKYHLQIANMFDLRASLNCSYIFIYLFYKDIYRFTNYRKLLTF